MIPDDVIRDFMIFGGGMVLGAIFGMFILALMTITKADERLNWSIRTFIDEHLTEEEEYDENTL